MNALPSTVEKANQLPPNRVARAMLQRAGHTPDDRSRLHLLSLALWGLEQGIKPQDNSREPFDQDALAGTVANLSHMPVHRQFEILEWQDNPPDLSLKQDPQEAAQEAINRLWAELSPTLPDD